jgi:uncharacterized protein (DUF488 family)
MKLYTIGFTKTSAERFFKRLQRAGVKKVIDTRLHRDSQLAGFAKQSDLPFFLSNLAKAEYGVTELLAPTADILDAYRKKRIKWAEYEKLYGALLSARHVEDQLTPHDLDHTCLLCSEATPEHCHRRLAAEYLARAWGPIEIIHL